MPTYYQPPTPTRFVLTAAERSALLAFLQGRIPGLTVADLKSATFVREGAEAVCYVTNRVAAGASSTIPTGSTVEQEP